MADMSVIWLRVAAALYSLGLLHAILTLVRRRENLFRVALAAFSIGAVFHFVSIMEEGLFTHHCPITSFYETLSMCAFLVVVLYLFIHWRYRLESLSVFVFPLVFVMALVATMGNPVYAWSSPVVRNAWLTVHIVLVLLGYAALLLTAVASVVYLFQERQLKSKKPRKFSYRLPPLGTLDDLISKSMTLGFALMTLAVIAASTWAFIEHKEAWIKQPAIAISFFTWGAYLAMVFCGLPPGGAGARQRYDGDRARVFRLDLARSRAPGRAAEAMKLLLTGVSHKTAPVEVRERLAFREESLNQALAALKACARRRRSRHSLDLQPGRDRLHHRGQRRSARHRRRVPRRQKSVARYHRTAHVPPSGPRRHPPPVPRGRQPRLDGSGRAPDSRPAQGRLRRGQIERRAVRLAGRALHARLQRGQARALGNRHRPDGGLGELRRRRTGAQNLRVT